MALIPSSRSSQLIISALVIGLVALSLPFLPPPSYPPTGLIAFMGRLHPLLIHVPIVLLLFPLVLEFFQRRHPGLSQVLSWLWPLSCLSIIGSVLAGYFLYLSGDYSGSLVRSHLWAGVILLLVSLAATLVYRLMPVRSSRLWYRVYLVFACVATGLVVYTGHLGGSLTHGVGYLADAFPTWGDDAPRLDTVPPEELLVYGDLIRPALEVRCMSCHNAYQAKGGLVMESLEDMQAGGDSGDPVITPGRIEESELYRRISLPRNDDDHMPPLEKPPLKAGEVELIRWWIETGANPDMRLGTGPDDPVLETFIRSYVRELTYSQRRAYRNASDRAELALDLAPIVVEEGLVLEPDLAVDTTWYAISMQIPPAFVDDETLVRLLPYVDAVSTLSLVSSEITNDGLYHISKMPSVRRLFLQKTGVDGEGLVYLSELPNLQVLNLSFTNIGDEGVLHLMDFPALQEVYLYETGVDDHVIDALRAHRPEVDFLQTEGPYY